MLNTDLLIKSYEFLFVEYVLILSMLPILYKYRYKYPKNKFQ